MKIDIYEELKRAIKDALTEWSQENKSKIENIHSKMEASSILLTIKQFCEKYPFIKEGGLRSKLFCREWNGLNQCMSKVGKRILIKEKEALEWFKNPPSNANWTYDKKKYGHD